MNYSIWDFDDFIMEKVVFLLISSKSNFCRVRVRVRVMLLFLFGYLRDRVHRICLSFLSAYPNRVAYPLIQRVVVLGPTVRGVRWPVRAISNSPHLVSMYFSVLINFLFYFLSKIFFFEKRGSKLKDNCL